MRKIYAVLPLLTALAGSPAYATVMGDTFNGSYLFPDANSVALDGGNATVNPTASFVFPTGTPNVTATISGTQIVLTFDAAGSYNPASFSGIRLTDLTKSDITGFSLASISGITGFDSSDLLFTSNSLSLNLQGIDVSGSTATIIANISSGAVPEPASWAMMVAGFGLVGAGVRASRKRTKISFA